MKRFEISNDGVIKDNRHISFPEILDMGPYCTTKCIEVCNNVVYNYMSHNLVVLRRSLMLHSDLSFDVP